MLAGYYLLLLLIHFAVVASREFEIESELMIHLHIYACRCRNSYPLYHNRSLGSKSKPHTFSGSGRVLLAIGLMVEKL